MDLGRRPSDVRLEGRRRGPALTGFPRAGRRVPVVGRLSLTLSSRDLLRDLTDLRLVGERLCEGALDLGAGLLDTLPKVDTLGRVGDGSSLALGDLGRLSHKTHAESFLGDAPGGALRSEFLGDLSGSVLLGGLRGGELFRDDLLRDGLGDELSGERFLRGGLGQEFLRSGLLCRSLGQKLLRGSRLGGGLDDQVLRHGLFDDRVCGHLARGDNVHHGLSGQSLRDRLRLPLRSRSLLYRRLFDDGFFGLDLRGRLFGDRCFGGRLFGHGFFDHRLLGDRFLDRRLGRRLRLDHRGGSPPRILDRRQLPTGHPAHEALAQLAAALRRDQHPDPRTDGEADQELE